MLLFFKIKSLKFSTFWYGMDNTAPDTHWSCNNLTRVKFVVLASCARIISHYLLPMLFLVKFVHFFLIYFRFLTLRSTSILGREVKRVIKRKNMCTLLGPVKPFKVPVNLLIRYRIPFVFSIYRSNVHWALTKYRFLNAAFGLYKIQRIFKLQTFR